MEEIISLSSIFIMPGIIAYLVHILGKKRSIVVNIGYIAFTYFISLCGGLIISWFIFFRDGLGPDSVTSFGWEAIEKSMPGIVYGIIVMFSPMAYFFFTRKSNLNE